MRRVVDWWFRDRATGRITIAQWPNVALWIFLVATALRVVLDPADPAGTVLRVVGTLALLWWAFDELLRGVNPFRRVLGGAVIGWMLGGWFTA